MVLEAIHNDGLKVLIRTNMVKDYFSYREQLVIGQFFTIMQNFAKYVSQTESTSETPKKKKSRIFISL